MLTLGGLIAVLGSVPAAHADDTELFFTNHDNDGDEEPGEEGVEDGKTEADCFIGTESGGCGFTDDFIPTYWFQNETQ
jgi:hypothetical protein